MDQLDSLIKDLRKLADKEKAVILARFFKTGKGQYGEGDIFLGITVPAQREVAKKYKDLTLSEVEGLLKSKIHEYRLTGLLILVEKFKNTSSRHSRSFVESDSTQDDRESLGEKANEKTRKKIVDFYLKNTKYINNWDLVDLSANHILGTYLLDKDASILKKLAASKNLWKRRIAIIATFAFIYKNEFKETLEISRLLVSDPHDLIQKAVGWMLREIGKKNQEVEEAFLKQHYKKMPRTMLRYAIERFDERKRKVYLTKVN